MNKLRKKLWIGIIILAVISPAGILLPQLFKSGDAWGEWSVETIMQDNGFIPEGMNRTADMWHSPVTDYSFFPENSPLKYHVLSYIGSALLGLVIVSLVISGIRRISAGRNRNRL